uniref:Secreted protein n=2 Tax=Lygus hesperus TaxID=30085 RepID=A0A146M1A7_LYGHE
MMNLGCFIVSALILAVPVTARKDDIISFIEGKLHEAAFANGRSQILAADLSPECRHIALTRLEEAKAGAMTCEGASEVLADVGTILDQAFNSTSDFITDLNTLFNGIPGCFEDRSWYNFLSIITCFVGEIKPIINASSHVNNFTDYYMDTINKIKELMDCMGTKKSKADDSVKKIVKAASLCSTYN